MSDEIPVVLFAYARPHHLRRTLACLRENRVPRILAFSDGPRSPADEPGVRAVRDILRAVNWCKLELRERAENLGLGRSVRAGVTEALAVHEAVIVAEDDLVFVPGAYEWLCAALRRYREEERVMSVTGWTHPSVTPPDAANRPYFDGRAECWLWGTWARAWPGMEQDALSLLEACAAQGIDPNRYGHDLPGMARIELERNIWAVRFLYLHILRGGLCLRPPWSMVEHIGFDDNATNARTADPRVAGPPTRPCPPLPDEWPAPVEHPACSALWRAAYGPPGPKPGLVQHLRIAAGRALRLAGLKA